MNEAIVTLTLRQVAGRKRVLLLLLGALLPVILAVVYRLSDPEEVTPQDFTANFLFIGLITFVLLPLTALVMGTSVLGGEIDDGTAVYLLSKPIPRYEIVFSKFVVSWLATLAVVVPAAVVSGAIALWGENADGIVAGFVLGVVAGAFAYTALFILLSIVTTRALIAGLVYVFVWEGVVTGLFSGTRSLSVREYSIAIADAFASIPGDSVEMTAAQGVLLVAVVSVVATWLAVRRLEEFEIGEAG